MTPELITQGGFMILVLGFISGAWWRVESKIKEAKSDAQISAEAASTRATLAMNQVAELRIHVAENYTSQNNLASFRDEVMSALGAVKSSVDHMNERVDRVIEADRTPRRSHL